MKSDAARGRSRYVHLALIVLGIALTLRLLHVLFTERYNPLAGDLQLDAATYDRWARAIALGGSSPTNLMQAPLFPWFLALIYRLFGPSLAAVRLVQALLGTATVWLTMLCTRRLFESEAASIIAGILAALYAPLIFQEGVLVPATLIVFLTTLFVAVLFSEDAPSAARLLASGLVLALAADANPPSLIVFPFALVHLSLTARGARVLPFFAKRSLILVAGLVIGLAPVAVRNWRVSGELIPTTTGGGINFYIGNNPDANGFYAVPRFKGKSIGGTAEEQMKNMQEIASTEAGRRLSPSQVSKFWLDAGLAWVRENPRAWAALAWRKFLFFWNRYERANVENFYFHRRFPGVLRLPLFTFGIIAPLGLLGVFLTRSRWKSLWLPYGAISAGLLTGLAFYVLSRYRLPVVPFLLMFAGAAVAELFALARSRRLAELALSLAALVLLAIFTNMTVAKDTPFGTSSNLTRLGNAYIARGDTLDAEKSYREALMLNAGNALARERLERLRTRYR